MPHPTKSEDTLWWGRGKKHVCAKCLIHLTWSRGWAPLRGGKPSPSPTFFLSLFDPWWTAVTRTQLWKGKGQKKTRQARIMDQRWGGGCGWHVKWEGGGQRRLHSDADIRPKAWGRTRVCHLRLLSPIVLGRETPPRGPWEYRLHPWRGKEGWVAGAGWGGGGGREGRSERHGGKLMRKGLGLQTRFSHLSKEF